MAPILIDTRGLIKLGIFSLFITVAVFVAGFISGIQQASVFYDTASEPETLALPSKHSLNERELEQQPPTKIVAGEAIDVDYPGLQIQQTKKSLIVLPPSTADTVKSKTKVSKSDDIKPSVNLTNKSSDIAGKDQDNILVVKQDASVDVAVTENSTIDNSAYQKPTILDDVLLPGKLNKAKYSVQVAMYRRFENAEKMVDLLQEQHFNAYVSDVTNRKNERRFNVRFGYFTDKKSALVGLRKYESSKNGEGYLVNFSISNIITVADTTQVEVDITEPLLITMPDVIAPSEIISNNAKDTDVSITDKSKVIDDLLIAQTKASEKTSEKDEQQAVEAALNK
ncbi:MAG: hypothetical protein COB77_02390 [Gammaproteobacteria bacterium]|nr:MAG: hypothetical protein COB77_02390 [Gammaproteobacteria bacterium]